MTEAEIEIHDKQVKAVMAACAKLLPKLEPLGFTAEAIFEGCVKGGAVAVMASGASSENVADMLAEMEEAFRKPLKPALTVVS